MLSLLRMRLYQAIDRHGGFAEAAADYILTKQREQAGLYHTEQAIPIKRLRKAVPFVYVCAIAHRLATPSQPAAVIAAQLVDQMLQADPALRTVESPDLLVRATSTGLLQFELGDRTIAAWLDFILTNALPQPLTSEAVAKQVIPNAAIFEVQYAHARCCSLLRLAHSEALITLHGRIDAPLNWRITSPPLIPWLTSTNQLCLNHVADRSLLGHLVEALDCLSDYSPRRAQRVLRSAQAIAQAMQQFHRVHPLWCKTGTQPNLIVAQLGLLMATQRILYCLLLDGLNLHPTLEL